MNITYYKWKPAAGLRHIPYPIAVKMDNELVIIPNMKNICDVYIKQRNIQTLEENFNRERSWIETTREEAIQYLVSGP